MAPYKRCCIRTPVLLLGMAIFPALLRQLPAQQAPANRPDWILSEALPTGDEHVGAVLLFRIPQATSGGAQAAVFSDHSIYIAGKAWNQDENVETLWLWRLHTSGKKIWKRVLVGQTGIYNKFRQGFDL